MTRSKISCACVGIIPRIQEDWLLRFACGLTTPPSPTAHTAYDRLFRGYGSVPKLGTVHPLESGLHIRVAIGELEEICLTADLA
jgi:hypothetical protein